MSKTIKLKAKDLKPATEPKININPAAIARGDEDPYHPGSGMQDRGDLEVETDMLEQKLNAIREAIKKLSTDLKPILNQSETVGTPERDTRKFPAFLAQIIGMNNTAQEIIDRLKDIDNNIVL